MLRAIEGDNIRAVRGQVLLAVGKGGAFAGSKSSLFGSSRLAHTPEGLRIHVSYAKNDQFGRGADVVIPDRWRIAPMPKAWVAAAPITLKSCRIRVEVWA